MYIALFLLKERNTSFPHEHWSNACCTLMVKQNSGLKWPDKSYPLKTAHSITLIRLHQLQWYVINNTFYLQVLVKLCFGGRTKQCTLSCYETSLCVSLCDLSKCSEYTDDRNIHTKQLEHTPVPGQGGMCASLASRLRLRLSLIQPEHCTWNHCMSVTAILL